MSSFTNKRKSNEKDGNGQKNSKESKEIRRNII